MQVVKRSGAIVEWDTRRIEVAIFKAMESVYGEAVDDRNPVILANEVVDFFDGQNVVPVEDIQDQVERVLMESYPDVAKAYILYRQRHAEMRERHPDKMAIADYIHNAKYAKHNGTRRETYDETCDRVQLFFDAHYPLLSNDISVAMQMVRERRVLPSMRLMQFAGQAAAMHNSKIYNCCFTYIDRLEVFHHAFYLLLCGCGVGFSVQTHHVAKLPRLVGENPRLVYHHRVADSIEGWADSIKVLMSSFHEGFYVEFDYSQIRPEGSPLHMSGGRAPGHLPLKALHEKLRTLYKDVELITTLIAHDTMCLIAEAVLSGGIRRSSLISLFSLDDTAMLTAKSPKNFVHGGLNEHRAMANNSAVIVRTQTTKAEFDKLLDLQHYGEPGFYFTTSKDYGCNPCAEIGLYPQIDGKSGFAFCNLTEINWAAITTEADAVRAAEAASFLGTLQAGLTVFPYLGEVSERIARRDALLGVSMTGIMDNVAMSHDPDLLRKMVQVVDLMNQKISALIDILPAARLTTIKPSGTASLALGCVGSGLHDHHARRYFRRITANPNESVAQAFRNVNPQMVEVKPNGDWCITFPVEAPEGVRQVPAMAQLERALFFYRHWVKPGTMTSPSLTHNVSVTISYAPEELAALMERIWAERMNIAAVSLLERGSDKGIPFMPREEVVTLSDIVRWNELVDKYVPIDYASLVEEDYGRRTSDPACAGGSCEIFDPVRHSGDGRYLALEANDQDVVIGKWRGSELMLLRRV